VFIVIADVSATAAAFVGRTKAAAVRVRADTDHAISLNHVIN